MRSENESICVFSDSATSLRAVCEVDDDKEEQKLRSKWNGGYPFKHLASVSPLSATTSSEPRYHTEITPRSRRLAVLVRALHDVTDVSRVTDLYQSESRKD
jgi:hypothetical protein